MSASKEIVLNEQIIPSLTEADQASIHAGRFGDLQEDRALIAACFSMPYNREIGVNNGDALVVARLNEKDTYTPEVIIHDAVIDELGAVRDGRTDFNDRKNTYRLSTTAHGFPYFLGEGVLPYPPYRLFLPAAAYGLWLSKNPDYWEDRIPFTELFPKQDATPILRIGTIAIASA